MATTATTTSAAKIVRHVPGDATSPPISGPNVTAPKSAGTTRLAVAASFSLVKFTISGGSTTTNRAPAARPCATCAASSTTNEGASALARDDASETPSSQKYSVR